VRIVLDSSALIAAHATRAGVCAALYQEVLERHDLVLSRYIVAEVRRKLLGKFQLNEDLANRITRELLEVADIVEPAELPHDSCRDSADSPVLGTAVAADADWLITVDKDLLALVRYGSVCIIKPASFWKRTQWHGTNRVQDADADTSDLVVDRDVIDWFKSQGDGYQTRINAVLRRYMEAQRR
jgi:putative PIN family toxin of toxin-antitoxin system